jgi:Calcineurin-like phosphoesterase
MMGPASAPVPAHGATRRIAVVGDVGGHVSALKAELVRLGADPVTGSLPDDLTVIQVGDLVHRGPDSAGVVRLVDRFLCRQPGQWVQLVGNHEAQYLRAPAFAWPERLDQRSAEILRRWWSDGELRVAVAFTDVAGREHLVTHAGVTAGFWREALDAPPSAAEAAATLNALPQVDEHALFRAGRLLHGRREVGPVGPLWACASSELVPSWLGLELPFSQVHGHSSLYDWRQRSFRCSREIRALTVLDAPARHEITSLPGGWLVGVDPGHRLAVSASWRAWEVDASLLH